MSSASWTRFSPKSRWPGGSGRADGLGAECLGDGDQPDVGGVTGGTARRRVEAAAHGLEIIGDLGPQESRYLIVASRFLTVSAFLPFGASFRYSWNGGTASFNLP